MPNFNMKTQHIIRVNLDLKEMFKEYGKQHAKLEGMTVIDANVTKFATGGIVVAVDFAKEVDVTQT